MAKRREVPVIDVANMQPDELGALKKVVNDFMERYKNVQNEIDLLKEDEKNLIEEFIGRWRCRIGHSSSCKSRGVSGIYFSIPKS